MKVCMRLWCIRKHTTKKLHRHHLKGKKTNFKWRVDTPDRLGIAGVNKIGLGCLAVFHRIRTDALYAGFHLDYLEKKFGKQVFPCPFPNQTIRG